jgi:hypothetical protein
LMLGFGFLLAKPLSAQKKKPTKPTPSKTATTKKAPTKAPETPPVTMPTELPTEFVGGACQTNDDCSYPGGICLSEKDGFPGGMCSMECDLLCPRADLSLIPSMAKAGASPTLCVTAKQLGYPGTKGLCTLVSKPNEPDAGCRPGYVPTIQVRNSAQDSLRWVCTPAMASAPESCAEVEDEIIEIAYPDKGRVYVPKEARCGGRFDLIIIMHGDQANIFRTAPNLGEAPESNRLDLIVRGLIDEKKSRPVLLAEPVENNWTCNLWDEDGFSPTYYISKVKEALAAKKIELGTISVFGHSRGACCLNGGVYRMGQVIPNLKLWGKSDGCYKEEGFDTYPEKVLAKTNAVVFTLQKTSRLKDTGHLEAFTGKSPQSLVCDSKDLKSCYKHPTREWYSFQSDSLQHREIPKLFIQEILTRFFPPL